MCSETAPFVFESTNEPEWAIDQSLSIYIKFVRNEYANEDYIKNVLYNLNIGKVKRVDFYPKGEVIKYSNTTFGKSAYIYMESWFNNITVEHLQERILGNDNREARIVHDDPEYWVLERNTKCISDDFMDYCMDQLTSMRNKLFTKIQSLEEKNLELETNIKEMQWWIRLHDTNINFMSNTLNLKVKNSHTHN